MPFLAPRRTRGSLLLLALLAVLSGCAPIRRTSTYFPPRPPPPVTDSTAPVLLVQPSASVTDISDRKYFQRMAAKLTNWLQESGIPVSLTDDVSMPKEIHGRTRIVILVSQQKLSAGGMRALSGFARRGGKLVVFHSADPDLASLMGVSLSPRVLASRPGQWSAFRFTAHAPSGTPARIRQDSLGLRPAYPAAPSAEVIAWWEDSKGRRSAEPAWLRTSSGFWMSHMLLEGDTPAKKQLLVALLGACDAGVWKAAARHALQTAGTLDRYPSAGQAIIALQQRRPTGRAAARFQSLLAQAGQLTNELGRLYRMEQFEKVITTARILDTVVLECYAQTFSPARKEFRGVWNHSGTGLYPGNWETTCGVLGKNGIHAVFPHVQRPWNAHYRKTSLPSSALVATVGDTLADCVAAARRHHLEVHAWVIGWNMEGAPESILSALRKEGRLQVSSKGESLHWLCPSSPQNRKYQETIILELARNYAVDGIHLDYMRYPSSDACYCTGCRERFRQATGKSLRNWPRDVRSGPLAEDFRRWRADQITSWIAELRQDMRRITPKLQLSAAVYPGYPGCRDSIGQDWGTWAKRDLVDFLCPMSYTEKTQQMRDWCRTQASFPEVRGKLVPGIGVTANESRLNAAQVLDQIEAIRGESLRGYLLFDANHTLEEEILPYLSMGSAADPF